MRNQQTNSRSLACLELGLKKRKQKRKFSKTGNDASYYTSIINYFKTTFSWSKLIKNSHQSLKPVSKKQRTNLLYFLIQTATGSCSNALLIPGLRPAIRQQNNSFPRQQVKPKRQGKLTRGNGSGCFLRDFSFFSQVWQLMHARDATHFRNFTCYPWWQT